MRPWRAGCRSRSRSQRVRTRREGRGYAPRYYRPQGAGYPAVPPQGKAPDLLPKVLHMYLNHAPQLLNTMRDAVAHSDAPALQQAAHSLKSSSANVGAMQLAAFSKEMEALGKAQQVTQAVSLLSHHGSRIYHGRGGLAERTPRCPGGRDAR